MVIVNVLDISDHPPLFLMSNYSGTIFENAPIGTTILTVKTSDLDTVIVRMNEKLLTKFFNGDLLNQLSLSVNQTPYSSETFVKVGNLCCISITCRC